MSSACSSQPAAMTATSTANSTATPTFTQQQVHDAVLAELEERPAFNVQTSITSMRTVNPIRRIVEKLQVPRDHPAALIPLSLGDPTVFGNFHPPSHALDALVTNLHSEKFNGYGPSTGYVTARSAIAQRYSTHSLTLTPNDVIITSGCSHALALAIMAICDSGDNMLIPSPGFPLYETICCSQGTQPRFYRLLPDRQWEIDFDHLTQLIDHRTKAILINNPSNPTGSNYSRAHLSELLKLASKYKLPIISDEIYADMVFEGETFTPLATVDDEYDVPIITVGGLAKQFVVPGWRIGWMCLYDRVGAFSQLRVGLENLSQLIVGANTLTQSVIAPLLLQTPLSYYTDMMQQLQVQAMSLYDRLLHVKGLVPLKPQGAMYLMARVCIEEMEDIVDDADFARRLLAAENVFVLPATCFHAPNFVRFVFCAPEQVLIDAAERIQRFCQQHLKPQFRSLPPPSQQEQEQQEHQSHQPNKQHNETPSTEKSSTSSA